MPLDTQTNQAFAQVGADIGGLADTRMTYLTSSAGFATTNSRQRRVFFDGSEWVRKTGTITPNGGTTLAGPTGVYFERKMAGTGINVQWFGADPTGSTDSSAAFQAAVDLAKSQAAQNGGTFRYHVMVPNGWYLIYTTINCTETNGLLIKSMGGNYINTAIIGNTSSAVDGSGQGIIFDFTGSTASGIEGFHVTSDAAWGKVASKIGVQFALGRTAGGSQTGGLRCVIKNCYIEMANLPAANGGYGTIGLLNCRAEEFTVRDCVFEATTPVLFTNHNTMSGAGMPGVTFTSPYATVHDNLSGSMGVIDMSGVSLLGKNKYRPALILNGTNGLRFNGYMGRQILDEGTYQTAIAVYQTTYGLQLSGTIESYQTIMLIAANCQLINPQFKLSVANQSLPTTGRPELFPMGLGSIIRGGLIDVVFGNGEPEMSGRNFFSLPAVAGGNEPGNSSITNCVISCDAWANNYSFIPMSLLKQCNNAVFYTGQPFRMDGGTCTQLFSYSVSAGSIGSVSTAQVLRFNSADRPDTSQQNGGQYTVEVEGWVRVGGYGSGDNASCKFVATAIVSQRFNSAKAQSYFTLIVNKASTNAAIMDIKDVNISLDVSAFFFRVLITPVVTGSGIGEGISIDSRTKVKSDFYVNASVVLA